MSSFIDVRDSQLPKSYLRSPEEWAVVEKKFQEDMPAFLKNVSVANPVVADPFVFSEEKIVDPQPQKQQEVVKKVEIKQEIKQVQHASTVESKESGNASGPVQEKSVVERVVASVAPATPATKEREVKEEDVFGEVSAEPHKVTFDDFVFADDLVPQVPASIAALPKSQPKESETIQMAPVGPAVGPVMKFTAEIADPPTPKPKAKEEAKPHAGTMDGFDNERFQCVRATAEDMLTWVPNVDLDFVMSHLGDYSVSLDMNHLRENPYVLTDKLLEVQRKRDSLHAEILKVTPAYYNMSAASKYIETAGLECSSASSREKRIAQIKLAIPEFWVRQARIATTHETTNKVFEHLEGQYECISRLITCLQMKMKIPGEIARGENLYEEPAPEAPETIEAREERQVAEAASKPLAPALRPASPKPPPEPKPEGCEDFSVGRPGRAKEGPGTNEW